MIPSMRTTGRVVGNGRSYKCSVRAGLLGITRRRPGCCTFVLHAASSSRNQVTGRPVRRAVLLTWRAPSHRRSQSVAGAAVVTHLVTRPQPSPERAIDCGCAYRGQVFGAAPSCKPRAAPTSEGFRPAPLPGYPVNQKVDRGVLLGRTR
jgi:hypothetical protein